MKSKEEILYLIAENEPDQFDEFAKWVDQNGGADEIDTDLTFKMAMQAMDEYASQQTAAITAERDEYRKALEMLKSFRYDHWEIREMIIKIFAKYPQQ